VPYETVTISATARPTPSNSIQQKHQDNKAPELEKAAHVIKQASHNYMNKKCCPVE
jgi:hypothetical protein